MNELHDFTLLHYSIVPYNKYRTNDAAEGSLIFYSFIFVSNYFQKNVKFRHFCFPSLRCLFYFKFFVYLNCKYNSNLIFCGLIVMSNISSMSKFEFYILKLVNWKWKLASTITTAIPLSCTTRSILNIEV
jgi:uncharacterized protein YydD (DUF2326 family)